MAGVALAHKRNAILCELNPEYVDMIKQRIVGIKDYYRKQKGLATEKEIVGKKKKGFLSSKEMKGLLK